MPVTGIAVSRPEPPDFQAVTFSTIPHLASVHSALGTLFLHWVISSRPPHCEGLVPGLSCILLSVVWLMSPRGLLFPAGRQGGNGSGRVGVPRKRREGKLWLGCVWMKEEEMKILKKLSRQCILMLRFVSHPFNLQSHL